MRWTLPYASSMPALSGVPNGYVSSTPYGLAKVLAARVWLVKWVDNSMGMRFVQTAPEMVLPRAFPMLKQAR
jgi:hypothetical protein